MRTLPADALRPVCRSLSLGGVLDETMDKNKTPFKVVRKCVVRVDFDAKSEHAGFLKPGTVFS